MHHHILEHLLHLLLGYRSFSPFILSWSLAASGQVVFFGQILTAKISLWSSVIALLGFGFLHAISLHVPGHVTGVTVAQGIECVLTIGND